MNPTATTDLTTAVWPGGTPRLLQVPTGREDYADYAQSGGYRELPDPDRLLEEVELSGLLGRGGAAFPMAVKLRSVRDHGRARGGAVAIANGEEGEPASIKDRWLLRRRPHLVLDGLRLAARMVAADRAVVYVSDPEAARSVETALSQIDSAVLDGVSVSVVCVDAGYVAGEETAAVRAVNGGPAKPTDKPPRPFEEGWAACPPWSATSRRWRTCRTCTATGRAITGRRAPRRRPAPSWPPSPGAACRRRSTNSPTASRWPMCCPGTESPPTGWAGC
ncbi:hypothetical protein MLIT_05600 [Mycolicibacterium litorale]|uniref:NADH-ubiquinone oxidoreductase 51kDa subunit FMN-binding domain-containing protein n=1 Tax=Mycolicibacterium litorale TaxID=758802 RepID=A0AAD1MS97_9MYCO|nr:hypothetical protein MLIT_05600 [Mycolicibacterium litorale]